MTTIVRPFKHITLSRISFVLIVFSLILPLSALAEDSKSIDTLRQLGKAFASIAEKDSPAVVSIKANQAITQTYSRDGPLAIRLLTMNSSSNFSAGSSAGSSRNNSNRSSKEKSSGPFRVPALSSHRMAISSQIITSSKTPKKSR